MSNRIIKFIITLFLISLISPVFANQKPIDTDNDGVPDKDELEIYHTNVYKKDTDSDGFSDWIELNTGYSPHNPKPVKLEDNDYDNDGLSDRMELNFHINLTNPDTDSDGISDGEEIKNGYDPSNPDKDAKLSKKIEINTGKQKLSYFLGGVRMETFIISSGVPSMPTPKGLFKIDGKHPRAWSSYGLWMPYWVSFKKNIYGIHELPEWPNGEKEGTENLGKPASHGCVRLGTNAAKFLYNWAEIGTPVFIY